MQRVQTRALLAEAANSASQLLLEADAGDLGSDSLDERLLKLERDDQIESLLNEIKARPGAGGLARLTKG
jgi:hypothetical protein